MNKIIIPWPSNTTGDFEVMTTFLDEIGCCAPSFILAYIAAHGTTEWAQQYGKIEDWVFRMLDNHFANIGARVLTANYASRQEYYEVTVAYDRLNDMVCGDDVDFPDIVYSIVGVLRKYYADIALPALRGLREPVYLQYQVMNNGYAVIHLTERLGEQISEHYEKQQPTLTSLTPFSVVA